MPDLKLILEFEIYLYLTKKKKKKKIIRMEEKDCIKNKVEKRTIITCVHEQVPPLNETQTLTVDCEKNLSRSPPAADFILFFSSQQTSMRNVSSFFFSF